MICASTDISTRYLLPEDAPYLANLAALWAVDPALARRIEALEDDPRYIIETGAGGEPTLRIESAGGRSVYMHSRHRPRDEARRLIAPIEANSRFVFHLHGLGLGYHLEELFDAASDEALFCIHEPDLHMLRCALTARDLSRVLASGRVLFFTRGDKAELITRLTPHSALITLGAERIRHGPSVRRNEAFHRQVDHWLDEFEACCRMNIQTAVLNGRRTAENIARNIDRYASAPGVDRLSGRFAGCPAIIVSAGPSLRKNKHLLKTAQGRAVIIAVQTMLQPLLEMGIEPHFATALDYHDICTRFYEKLPPQLSTELVAEPKATARIFPMFPGPITLLGNEFAEGLLREMELNKPTLRSGATVAHLAFYLAEHLGCDPIIFIGQDLGFSDGLCYAPGTSYEDVWRPELSRFCTVEMKQWEQIVRDRPILRRISDWEGRPMYTEERLFTYLQQFERDFLTSSRRIIDASEGGAAKRGAEPMCLRDALDAFCTRTLAIHDAGMGSGFRVQGSEASVLNPESRTLNSSECGGTGLCACRQAQRPAPLVCLEKRIEEARQIERIARETLPLLEELLRQIEDQPAVNRLIARIDALRAQMDSLGHCYELVIQMTQFTELRRFQHDRLIAAARTDGIERQRRQVERDIENVRGIIDAAGAFVHLIESVIAQSFHGKSVRAVPADRPQKQRRDAA